MKQPLIVVLCIAFLAVSCLKEELPVPSVPRGDARSLQECMGPGYRDQLWIDLGTATVVSRNDKWAWDLAFESGPDGWRITLNGARLMSAWDLGAVAITQAADTVGMGAAKRVDASSGHPDSTAIGDWRQGGHVFVIDLGFDAQGGLMGLRKVRPVEVNAQRYHFEMAQMDGSGLEVVVVDKDPTRGHVHYKFGQGLVPIEPARGTWDVVLTQYTHEFRDPYLAYIVAGMLSDRGRVRVAPMADAEFATVTLADTLSYPFTDRRDAIGYDWKTYSFETGSYQVDIRRVYIVQDAQGFFHKLHFQEFYNALGQTGCPLFSVKPL